MKKYGSDAIELILDYAGFKHLRSQLTTIIRSYDFKTLTDITTNCSDSSYVFICRIVNKDYVDRLTGFSYLKVDVYLNKNHTRPTWSLDVPHIDIREGYAAYIILDLPKQGWITCYAPELRVEYRKL